MTRQTKKYLIARLGVLTISLLLFLAPEPIKFIGFTSVFISIELIFYLIESKKAKRYEDKVTVYVTAASTQGNTDEEKFAHMTAEILSQQGIEYAGMNHKLLCATIAANFESLRFSYVMNTKKMFVCMNIPQFIEDVAILLRKQKKSDR